MAEEESRLWQRLRNGKLGFKFKRCPKIKLAIELDGEIHKINRKYDHYRTRYLESLGIKEIRFDNKLVTSDIEFVVSEIEKLFPLLK